jgi:hypothetical protein
MNDTIEADGASTSNWYFTENGQRKGPIATANLLELLEAEKISSYLRCQDKGKKLFGLALESGSVRESRTQRTPRVFHSEAHLYEPQLGKWTGE